MRRKIIAVIGGSQASEENLRVAEQIGALIAKNNAILICGGMSGVMEAAAKGAKQNNGLVIGILPGTDRNSANPYVDIPIVTGMGEARNVIIIRTCDCAIAIDGKYGTLSEIAYCMVFGIPVIGINTWDVDAPIIKVKDAEQAVRTALEKIK
jgi:uncharacterized protein (TIGR00725 family)